MIQVDPYEVIFDGLHAGNPFCGHADRPAMPLIEQCAREVHDSVAHHDVNEADRSQRLGLELRVEPLADGRVGGRARLRLGGNARQCVQIDWRGSRCLRAGDRVMNRRGLIRLFGGARSKRISRTGGIRAQ